MGYRHRGQEKEGGMAKMETAKVDNDTLTVESELCVKLSDRFMAPSMPRPHVPSGTRMKAPSKARSHMAPATTFAVAPSGSHSRLPRKGPTVPPSRSSDTSSIAPPGSRSRLPPRGPSVPRSRVISETPSVPCSRRPSGTTAMVASEPRSGVSSGARPVDPSGSHSRLPRRGPKVPPSRSSDTSSIAPSGSRSRLPPRDPSMPSSATGRLVAKAGDKGRHRCKTLKAEKDILHTSKTSVEPEMSPTGKEILFKVNDEAGDLYWFKASASNFDSVRKAAGKVTSIPSDDIFLQFVDGDGDKIALTGDSLLHEAVNLARGKSRAVRLFASPKPESTLTRQTSGVDVVPMSLVVSVGLGVAVGALIMRRK